MTPKYDHDGRTVFVTETKLRKFVCHCRTNAQAQRLAEKLNEAEVDKARLDWLLAFITANGGGGISNMEWTDLTPDELMEDRMEVAFDRAAIDAARKATPSPNR